MKKFVQYIFNKMQNGRRPLSLPLMTLLVLLSASASAQLGIYAFTGGGACPNQNPNVTTQPANAIFSTYTSVGTTCVSSSNVFLNNQWNNTTTINTGEYNEFTITPNSGYLLTLTSVVFTHILNENASGVGSSWVLRSSIDGYATNIGTGTATNNSQTETVTLLAANFTDVGAVTFRLYLINAKQASTTWRNDDVKLFGSATLPATPGNPTSNSPQCSTPGVTLTRTGTPPAAETWYWQTSAVGTSTTNSSTTYTVNTSGTYYIRARNNTSLGWSAGAGSLSVTITPTVGTPVFSLGATSPRCQAAGTVTYTATATNSTGLTYSLDATSLAGGNTINTSTGAITYISTWYGTSVITASATGCNGPVTSTHTATTDQPVTTPVFALGSTSTICQASGSVTYTATAGNTTGITYSLDGASITGGNTINALTGAVNYASTWSGTTTITASAAGCSGPLTATHTVTITPTVGLPLFTLGATSSRCQALGIVTYTANATTNTGITYSLDATSIGAGNTIDVNTGAVTYDAAWIGTSTITATATGCNGPRSSTHTVTTNGPVTVPVFTAGPPTVRCQGTATTTYTATANYTTGITYSLDAASITGSNTINASTGAVTYASTWSGTTTITASAAGCLGPQTSTFVVTVTPSVTTPVFTIGATSTRCQGAGVVSYVATANNTTGITYTLDATSTGNGNTINASTGDVTYAAGWSGTSTITATAAGCSPKTATHTVTITPTVGSPVFSSGATSVRCQSAGTFTYSATASNSTGRTYSLDASSLAAGNTINSSTGLVTYVSTWSGTSVITVTAVGCNGPSTATHTVTITPYVTTPVFTAGSTSVICQGSGSVTYTATASNTTGITYTLDATTNAYAGNSINSTTGAITYAAGWSGTTTITASAAGCSGPVTANHVVTITPTVGTPVFSLGATSSRCMAAGPVAYTATATNSTVITYSLDATSTGAGNSIDANTGIVTYDANWYGTSTITATATGCNGPKTSNHTVTTRALVTVPVFTAGPPTVRCQGTGTVTYAATASNTTGITYSLDGASLAGSNTINSATGAVTYASTWSGTSTITASAAGCSGPQTSTFTVTITPSVVTPVFAIGATSIRCQGAGVLSYVATATNSTDISYTLDAASVTGGTLINVTTGEVTYTSAYSGTTIITATAAGCSPKTATHTVTITPTVGTPVFTSGATSTRCQNAGTVTYTATASSSTGRTYTLDASSLAGGNTINSSTGAVTYVSTWSGTSAITVTATGCNGPSAATHTVTITPYVTTPVFTAGAGTTRCQGAATVMYDATANNTTGITYSLDGTTDAYPGNSINTITGVVTYAAGWYGASTITATAAGCTPRTATHTVTTIATVGLPVFSMGSTSSRCQAAYIVTYTATATTNTGITYTLDATSTAAGNSIDPLTGSVTYTAGWYGTSIITATATGCNGPRSSNHTATTNAPVATPVFDAGSTTSRCRADEKVIYSASANNALGGFTYTLDFNSRSAGNKIKASNGEVDWDVNWVGTSYVTVSAPGCYGPQTAMLTIITTPDVTTPIYTLGTTSTRCQGAGSVLYDATSSNNTGITYSLNSASISAGNSIDASTGMVTYVAGFSGTSTITATATGCNGPKTRTHTVTTTPTVGNPSFTLGATSTRCQGANTVAYSASATNAVKTYTLDAASTAAGNYINPSTGAVSWTAEWSGTTVITVTADGCNGPKTTTHTVTITPSVGDPIFALGSNSARCQAAGSVTYSASATTTTGITYTLDFVSLTNGNLINSSTGVVTYTALWKGTSTITASAAGCSGPAITTHTAVTSGGVANPVFSAGATSTRCQGAATITYTATATNATGMSYSIDAASIAGGNSINLFSGALTYTAGWSGTTIITATATGCYGPTSSIHTVTITPTVATPVFTSGSTSTRCQGASAVTYSATAATTITYTLDAASISAGNTINSTTGTVNYVTGWVGNSIITARAAGCGTPAATHTATSTPSVTTPVFTLGATSTRCQGGGSVTYTANSSNSTGITYSLDAISIGEGNTINTATGQVTYLASWLGTSVITAVSTGCNGPKTSSHTVNISSNGTPTFTMGSSSSRLQGAGTVTYTATTPNGLTITYTLDAASIGGGNTINSSTGAVTYTAGWNGTTIITASVTGCNGTITSTHTVTIASSTVTKQLYFSDPSQSLDRVDPVATADATTTNTSVLSSGSTTTFTQSPVLCTGLTIKSTGTISVQAYTTISSGSMPVNPNITAVIRYGSTNIITLSNPTYNGATGLLTWTGTLGADVAVPAGQSISLDITSAQAGVTFTISFDSQTKPSKINLPVSTYINVLSVDVYNAPYPGGIIKTSAVTGTSSYVRAVVTDPFGFTDITGLDVTVTPTGISAAATSVATSGCTRTYEYVWNVATGGNYTVSAKAKEGYENTVTSTLSTNFTYCTFCPPVALNDSAVGPGGTPVTIDVLANDSDPNNNLSPSSLSIAVQPMNGSAFISNGQIVYLPNGTFAGVDQFTYRICDLTSPTPLCATATVKVSVDPTLVDPCAEAATGHVYYVPYPEQDARTALIASSGSAYLPIPSNNIRTIISVKIPYPGMTIVWDQWEDGYETDILNPQQSTTKVWGDGNPFNGIAPGYSNDVIPAGGSIVLDNTMPANPRVASNFFYDGKDKVYSSGEITLTQVLGEPSIISVQAMKTNVSSTAEFGKSFTIPVGEDFNSQDFKYTALFIRASEDNTVVNIDKDNNGTFETTATLNQGQSLLVNGGVKTGATVTGSAPIGVDLHFGGVDGYSSREVPIFPATWYSNVYYTPVPTTAAPDTSVVMFYNSLSRPITINWTSGFPASGSITIPAKKVVRFPLAVYGVSTYKFVNPTGESFTAIEIVDSYSPGGGGNSGSTFDWAFNLIAEERLTTFATLAWAPGSTDGSRNDNPIWVTPATNTTIYVKYNGDVLTGGSISPCGLHYDISYPLNALKFKRIFDPNDNDQSGIAVYTCDGTKIAAVYGEDPSIANDANPSWDVGTTIKPYCATKLVFANDDYAYTITSKPVTIQVLNNDAGFTTTLDPASLTTAGYLQPKHGTVTVNSNGTLLYYPNPGFVGIDTFEYSICSPPIVVCDQAFVYVEINACPTPAGQNIISGQVFLDKNKDGVSNDGSTGFANAKVYLYADGNCSGTASANELIDSVIVDSSGSYQFLRFPEKTVTDDFDGTGGASSCASGTDGTSAWLSNWTDAGDISTGFCVTPAQSYANTNAEIVKDGAFSYALRLKSASVSATRTVNLSGATAAFLSFSYRRASALQAGENVTVQASTNGSTWGTIFTITGDGTSDATYTNVYNQDILAYVSATTYIRFVTNANVDNADETFIDNVSITYLKYPQCYITSVDPTSISTDYYFSTVSVHPLTTTGGGTCTFPFDFGIAKKIITISGTLYNDVNGLSDNLVNGTGTGAPGGNTVYAYLVDAITGKIVFKTNVNSTTGAYSFTQAEVNTNYTVVLSTRDSAVSKLPPPVMDLPAGWVSVGDAYGSINRAGSGIESGTPNGTITANPGLFNLTGVDFGIEQRPTAGSGANTALNPGGTTNVTVPANTFSNLLNGSDPSPGVISKIRIAAFPVNLTSITINGVTYTAANFPASGVLVTANSSGQPTQNIAVDPVDGFVKTTIIFYAVDNAGVESSLQGTAVFSFLLDTDRDGIADINDIDDDNDGITDVIEVCGKNATSFACTASGTDPALDDDGDGIVNWKDADYGTLNAAGCVASLDNDGDGVPDFLDLDSDNDGIPDVVEAGGVDANGDGVIDNFTDTDGDGLSQNVDANNSGASGSGTGLGFVDLDGDGIPNTRDLDSDGDGIPDIVEVLSPDVNNDGVLDVFVDTDGDGLADGADGDANNDGTIENTTGPLLKTGTDTNNDGKADSFPYKNADQTGRPNPYDLDSDGDGITDASEAGYPGTVNVSNGLVTGSKVNGWAVSVRSLSGFTQANTDGRGPADYLDIDSDDDGISDNVEGQPTFSYVTPTDTDADNDGILDIYELTVGTYGGKGITPYDLDADNIPDYKDFDTDGDGAPDINEGSNYPNLTQANINITDTDGDGLVDEFDNINISTLSAGSKYINVTNSNMGPLGNFNGPTPTASNVKLVRSQISGDRDWRTTTTLPLQIVSFYGNLQNNIATLYWKVENELDVLSYQVERSNDGVHFNVIGTVKALNKNNTLYTYPDDVSAFTGAKVYYRIVQYNKSGELFFTRTINMNLKSPSSAISFFPNPVTDVLNIMLPSPVKQTAQITVSDASGKTLINKAVSLEKGYNNLQINEVVVLPKGMFVVTIVMADNTVSQKIIK